MSTDHDTTNIVRSWLNEDERASADRILADVLNQIDALPQRRVRWFPARFPVMSPMVRVAVATATVTVLTIVTINLLPRSGGVGGLPPVVSTAPSASASPSSSAGQESVVGIPPEGTTPSNPEPGELVIKFDANITGTGTTRWVYGDGRLISNRFYDPSPGAGDAFIGLYEQRLTASGVEFLRSAIISTGLFDEDLLLAREGSAPYFAIQVQNGDRLVGVTWAWRGITGDAPVATQEQESALRSLNALFTNSASWPATAWEDQAVSAYVPSQYAICFGVQGPNPAPGEWLGPVEPAVIWALLPEAAHAILQAADPTQDVSMHANGGCSQVTTDDARTVAQILEGAGIHHERPGTGHYSLLYFIEDQETRNTIWMQFGPVLPDGKAIFLGPG
jgi:hypothetical protein